MTDTTALAAAIADRYTLDRELGRGGMATVYLARDIRHDRMVALKLLHPELGAVLAMLTEVASLALTGSSVPAIPSASSRRSQPTWQGPPRRHARGP